MTLFTGGEWTNTRLVQECSRLIEREVSTLAALVNEFSQFVRFPIAKLAPVGLAGQLTIDPIHKEIIAPNGARNIVMTFAWPEVFDEAAPVKN